MDDDLIDTDYKLFSNVILTLVK